MSSHPQESSKYLKDYEPQIDHLDTAALFLEHAGRKPNATEQAALAYHFETEITENIGSPEWGAATLGQRLDDMYEAAKCDLQDEAKIKQYVTNFKKARKLASKETAAQPLPAVKRKPVAKGSLPDGSAYTIYSLTKKGQRVLREEQQRKQPMPRRATKAVAMLAAGVIMVPTAFKNMDVAGRARDHKPVPGNIQVIIPGLGTES